MIRGRYACGLAIVVTAAGTAHADPMPAGIEAMIRAAKAEELDTTATVAKRAAPKSGKEIDDLVKQIKSSAEAAQKTKIANERFFQGFTGQVAAGLSISSGNTDETGYNASLSLHKRGINWEHQFDVKFDYLKTSGVVQREHYYAGYTGRYNLSGAFFFSFGLLSFESDRFAGFDRRFTESLGLGLRLMDKPRLKWSVETGPAGRETKFIDGTNQNVASLLTRTNVEWKPLPLLTITEEAGGVYAPSDDSTIYSHAALTLKLTKALGAQFGFDIDHETQPPVGSHKTNTTTRASVVYGF